MDGDDGGLKTIHACKLVFISHIPRHERALLFGVARGQQGRGGAESRLNHIKEESGRLKLQD